MGGGGAIYQSISPLELEGWGRISGTTPNRWELQQLRRMDIAFTARKNTKDAASGGKKHQGIGDYCQNKEVENCRKTFGEKLEVVCSTCPN